MRLKRNRSDASENGIETRAKKRRQGRGWGPFSGGQLTLIIVIVVVMVGLPVGAFAVSTSKVAVTDSTSGKTAAVTSSRQLQVHNNGTQTVAGTLKLPTSIATGQVNPGTDYSLLVGNGGHIDSIHVDVYESAPGAIQFGVSEGSGCNDVETTIDAVDQPPFGTTVLNYGPGGLDVYGNLCVRNTNVNSLSAAVFAFWH